MSQLIVSHEEYDRLCDRVVASIQSSGWHPDCILGVSRGGLRLADALSRSLKRPMGVIAASSYAGESGTQQAELRVSASIASVEPISGHVLLVDDLVDSGVTLFELLQFVPRLCESLLSIKTAVIWVKPHSKYHPDFYASKMTEDRWIVQPFEQRDF